MKTDASEERLSKYELIRLLGAGGMGEVYLARDTVLQRQVAIKFVSPSRVSDPAANARLLREARAAATLDHPGICPVYDVDVDPSGRTCIVMQYVEGETLAARLTRGPLEPREALELGAAVADALAAAHAHGIVHRDLKPQNIILTADGRPKLLDFGIAYAEVSPDAASELATHTSTSQWSPGALVGTPAYMSPEQVLRKPLDARTDLFSLGAVLFECLTGTPAFQAASNMDTWARVAYVTPPAPSALNPRVPPAADAVVARLLAKEPADRLPSAHEAASAIRQVFATPDTGAPGVWTGRRVAVAAVVMAAMATAGVSGWVITRPHAPAPTDQARDWYDMGTRHIRNGAYYSARKALHEAVQSYDMYPQAWVRLAEAQSELDDEREALSSLLRVNDLLKRTKLSNDDQMRVDAVSARVRRDLASALTRYQQIADAHPSDPGAWLDLGRIRETAGRRADAKAAFERALQVQPQYAAAHLRLGEIAAAELRRDDALKAFAEAERLYLSASDFEGQTETLLQRAKFLNAIGDLDGARKDLANATALAGQTGNTFQQIRASLLLSSVTASAGRFSEAATQAEEAASLAAQYGLGTQQAEGLIQSGTVRLQSTPPDSAGAQVRIERGIEAAKALRAHLVAARGTLQLAGVYIRRHQPQDALNVVRGVLPFLHDLHFLRYELVALAIMARANEDLGEYKAARSLAEEVLSAGDSLKDDAEVAGALEPLAGVAAASGALPQALALRDRLEGLHKKQQDRGLLPYDLTLRAEILIRLGRIEEAEAPLREVEAGIAERVDSYVGRTQKVLQLRALADTIQLRFEDAERHSSQVLSGSKDTSSTTSRLAAVLLAHARARLRRPVDARDAIPASDTAGSPAFLLELRYWRASTWLARGQAHAALDEVSAGLKVLDRLPSPEAEWRLGALGAAAARQLSDGAAADALAARAAAALSRLHDEWKTDAGSYDRRPDLIERRRAAGLS
jgi:tetratricopeptide (TPR) repeat protein/tRNA A-37 threonylcarbamoyl transferase component Bud32